MNFLCFRQIKNLPPGPEGALAQRPGCARLHPGVPVPRGTRQGEDSITRAGAALAQVTGARLSFSNGMETVRTIRADRKVEGVDPGIARCTGQITVRFENTVLLGQAQGGTPAEFAMAFTMDANRSLTITLHEVYLALAKTPIEGPAGVEASFDFRAAFNATAGRMMTVMLRNQQAGAEYG